MKKFTIAIVVSVGIVGLVVLTRFKANSSGSLSQNATPTSTTPLTTNNTPSSATTTTPATLKNGSYTGQAVDVGYGVVEVQAIVSGGKLTDVKYLSLPSGGHSTMVSNFAGPQLRSEALQAQSANVDIVSGATSTSEGFMQSLGAALSQAS